MNEIVLSIAGVNVGIEYKYSLSSWNCDEHKSGLHPQYTVSASYAEIMEEYERLDRQFSLESCECNCLYRKVCLGMLDYDAFLLHAAVVAVDGEGYAFTAPGGTGKSTHVFYWTQAFDDRAVIINGDKPIIRYKNGSFYVCGTPWRGKERLGNASIVPLKSLCLLDRGAQNEIARADTDTVIDRIFHQVLLPEDPAQLVKQLDLLDTLIREVPVYHLKCNMTQEAALVAYNGMNEPRKN